ncbi:hypothetical protein MKX01_027630 [Papaver californicum]|nr:hypothetical protein MKX01_027630 [Papaver californicum]
MVKAYTQEHVYKHLWERVTSAAWMKFTDPENKRILPHVLEVDTLNRKLDSEVERPLFIRKILGQDIFHCVELTVIDAKLKTIQINEQIRK